MCGLEALEWLQEWQRGGRALLNSLLPVSEGTGAAFLILEGLINSGAGEGVSGGRAGFTAIPYVILATATFNHNRFDISKHFSISAFPLLYSRACWERLVPSLVQFPANLWNLIQFGLRVARGARAGIPAAGHSK